ncbi:MAG: DUF4331 domain-containing protein [bacterium]|nr:DUF4331 domain-containing protein [bacterium]
MTANQLRGDPYMKSYTNTKLTRGVIATVLVAFVSTMLVLPLSVYSSSHREAPLISGDPSADGTDLYVFVSPDAPDTTTLIANYLPFQNPAGGPNFYTFDDNVLYDINIDNDGDAVPDITYQYKFTTTTQNPDTFLYNTGPIKSVDDPNWNIRQTYSLTKITPAGSTVLGTNIPTPPSNIGPTSTPNYEQLQAQAVKTVGNVKSFAGQSDDPFFADLGGIFDLLTIRKVPGNAGGGKDGLQGFNVQSLALQVPTTELTSDGSRPTDPKSAAAVIGVWTTSSRRSTTVLGGGKATASGDLVQVSRLGAPLVNEVVVPISAKDLWNSSKPVDDAQFANGVANPELGKLLNSLYKIKVPPQGNFGSAEQRDDLIAIFLTGIPELTKPANGKPSEQLRLNVAVPVTQNPNRLGVLAKDNQGYPNGRRLTDDVVDISEQAVAGAVYAMFHPDFVADPLATQVGDGVDSNDKNFRTGFPYLALPNDGFSTTLTPDGNNNSGDNDGDSSSNTSTGLIVGAAVIAFVVGLALASIIKRR